MTREELINNIVFCSPKWTTNTLNKIEMYVKQAYNDHEAQLKAKDEEIEKLKAELDNIGRKLFMI